MPGQDQVVKKARTLTTTDASYNAIALAIFEQLHHFAYRPKVDSAKLSPFLNKFANLTGDKAEWSAFLRWVRSANTLSAQAVLTPALKALVADMRRNDTAAKELNPEPHSEDLRYLSEAFHMNFDIAYISADDSAFTATKSILFSNDVPQDKLEELFANGLRVDDVRNALLIFDGSKFTQLHTRYDFESDNAEQRVRDNMRSKCEAFIAKRPQFWDDVKRPTHHDPKPTSRYQNLENFVLRHYDISPTVRLQCDSLASLHYTPSSRVEPSALDVLASPTLETLALLDTRAFKNKLSSQFGLRDEELEKVQADIIAARDAYLEQSGIPESAMREYGRYAASLFLRGISAVEFDHACALLCRLNVENGNVEQIPHPEIVLHTLKKSSELVNFTFKSTLFGKPEECTWLQKAAEMSDAAFAQSLLKFEDIEADANDNANKDTALHIACRHPEANLELVKALLTKCDINAQNAKGETAPMIAAQMGSDDLCRLFVVSDPAPDFTLTDKLGMTIADYHDRLLSTESKTLDQVEAEAEQGAEVVFPAPVKSEKAAKANGEKQKAEGGAEPDPVVKAPTPEVKRKPKRKFTKKKATEKVMNFRLKLAISKVQQRLKALQTSALLRPDTSDSKTAALDLYNTLNNDLAEFKALDKPTIAAKNAFLKKANTAIQEKKAKIEEDNGLNRLLWAIGVSLTGLGLVVITVDAFYHGLRDGVFKASSLDNLPGVSQTPAMLDMLQEGLEKDMALKEDDVVAQKPTAGQSLNASELLKGMSEEGSDLVVSDSFRAASAA